ncbi:hypothetical protein NKG94_10740 [Micromonospora sp. M12]
MRLVAGVVSVADAVVRVADVVGWRRVRACGGCPKGGVRRVPSVGGGRQGDRAWWRLDLPMRGGVR